MFKQTIRFSLPLLALCLAGPVHAATLTVNNLNDSGAGSLRQAIADATSGDTIDFSVTGTITLNSGEILVDKDLRIRGPGAGNLSISGNNFTRIFNTSARVLIADLTIKQGRTRDSGGGIYNTGSLTLLRDVIHKNRSELAGLGLGGGGGVYNEGTLILDRSRIVNNFVVGDLQTHGGGGIYSYGLSSRLELSRSLVANNTVEGEYVVGGGIYQAFGDVDIVNSSISNNHTGLYGYGGGMYSEGGGAFISGSTFSGNSTDWDGGGLYNSSTDITIVNSTFSDNSADNGAGIYHGEYFAPSTTQVTILHNTITNNHASIGTGGFHYTFSGPFQLERNLIAANSGISPDCGGSIPSLGYNLIGDGSGCNIAITPTDIVGSQGAPVLPQLGPLAGNGGPTRTHALLPGSPAIDQIPLSDCNFGAQPLEEDQRGFVRPVGVGCDIGAFELQALEE